MDIRDIDLVSELDRELTTINEFSRSYEGFSEKGDLRVSVGEFNEFEGLSLEPDMMTQNFDKAIRQYIKERHKTIISKLKSLGVDVEEGYHLPDIVQERS